MQEKAPTPKNFGQYVSLQSNPGNMAGSQAKVRERTSEPRGSSMKKLSVSRKKARKVHRTGGFRFFFPSCLVNQECFRDCREHVPKFRKSSCAFPIGSEGLLVSLAVRKDKKRPQHQHNLVNLAPIVNLVNVFFGGWGGGVSELPCPSFVFLISLFFLSATFPCCWAFFTSFQWILGVQ